METQVKTFINTKNDVELITYDYSHNKYREVINNAYKNGFQQVIFSTTKFKKLIEKIFDENMYLVSIDFMEPLDIDEFSEIRDLVNLINSTVKKKFLIRALLKEIDWFASNESIDIKCVTILDKDNNKQFHVYNNGVILAEDNQLNKIKNKLLKTILTQG